MISRINECRICKNTDFEGILHLGDQAYTGVFLKEPISEKYPLELVKCTKCHLVQLAHSFDPNELYGETYGYRSGLNQSMVAHLQGKVSDIVRRFAPEDGSLILDIGSNDSTLLQSYPEGKYRRIGIDPTGKKFHTYYPKDIELIPEFFSAKAVKGLVGESKFKVVTSIAMFYDLDDPIAFAREIGEVLDKDGVWVFEQSYMPTMLEQNAYDTICHEHLEYYALSQILYILDAVGMKLVHLEFNDVNGGSFSCTAAKKEAKYPACEALIEKTLRKEDEMGITTLKPFQEFAARVEAHRDELKKLIANIRSTGRKVFGYGASTKGNVVLQYCGFTKEDIPFIAEVNEEKFGTMTPGTNIPIISEDEARGLNPDVFMVLPWHFRQGIVRREQGYVEKSGNLLFPLPHVEIVGQLGSSVGHAPAPSKDEAGYAPQPEGKRPELTT